MFSTMLSTVRRSAPAFARAFSTESTELSYVPIRLHGLSGRYASALYGAARTNGELEKIEGELSEVLEMGQSGPFKDLLEDPFIDRKTKKEALEAVLKKANFSKSIVGFYGALAENNRVNAVSDIASDFERIMGAHRGVVEMRLVTPKPMAYHHKAKLLREITDKYLNPTDIIDVVEVVDESLIGGFVAEFQGMRIDESSRTRLQQLNDLIADQTEKLLTPPSTPSIPPLPTV